MDMARCGTAECFGSRGGEGMDPVKLASSACHFVTLKDALEQASLTLPGVQRTSAVKACLADNILALAASGEVDPARLGQRALAQVRQSCVRCGGCEGLIAVPQQQLLSPGEGQTPSRSVQGKRGWQ